jgi:hypothetical protein
MYGRKVVVRGDYISSFLSFSGVGFLLRLEDRCFFFFFFFLQKKKKKKKKQKKKKKKGAFCVFFFFFFLTLIFEFPHYFCTSLLSRSTPGRAGSASSISEAWGADILETSSSSAARSVPVALARLASSSGVRTGAESEAEEDDDDEEEEEEDEEEEEEEEEEPEDAAAEEEECEDPEAPDGPDADATTGFGFLSLSAELRSVGALGTNSAAGRVRGLSCLSIILVYCLRHSSPSSASLAQSSPRVLTTGGV